jgi:hypothetical protein
VSEGTVLLKLFITGIVLGIVVAGGALYAYPAVDQHREASIVKVAPNGGTVESFHINLPDDRIMSRSAGQNQPIPENLQWSADPLLEKTDIAIYKLRNERDAVVGLAARTSAPVQSGALVEWVLHLPARGSQFVSMQTVADMNSVGTGILRAGSREFADRAGSMTERRQANGRIELKTQYVGKSRDESE